LRTKKKKERLPYHRSREGADVVKRTNRQQKRKKDESSEKRGGKLYIAQARHGKTEVSKLRGKRESHSGSRRENTGKNHLGRKP